MKAQFTASRTFGAATRPEPDSGSDRLIMKTIRISATVTGEAMTAYHQLDEQLLAIRKELNGRILEDMMPGAATTLLGIAAWAMERLALSQPKLTQVKVEWLHLWDDGEAAVVLERDAR